MQQAKIVVAGATGRLGRHVVDVLGAAGHGSLLPGPHAKLAGPTFEEWLTTQPDSGSTGV